MTKKQFNLVLQEELQNRLGDQIRITTSEVQKNNGKILQGIIIKNPDYNIAPTIYTDQYYEEYYGLVKGIDSIVDEICEIYENNKIDQNYDLDFFMDFSKVKEKIVCELINYEENTELLKTVPHIKYLDLAIVFRVMCTMNKSGAGTILINKNHLEMWKGVSSEELFQIALENTQEELGFHIRKMSEVLKDFMNGTQEPYLDEEMEEKMPMYVLSNKHNFKGAITILYPDVLTDFARACNTDLYILPSSVHEVLLLPVKKEDNVIEFQKMVCEINETEVALEDKLSDHVYFFNKATSKVSIIA